MASIAAEINAFGRVSKSDMGSAWELAEKFRESGKGQEVRIRIGNQDITGQLYDSDIVITDNDIIVMENGKVAQFIPLKNPKK